MKTSTSTEPRPWVNGQIATGRRFIPNVIVETHTGEKKLFYDDLVRDRTVIVQFTSIARHAEYPVTRNLRNVQRLLGPRCGRDVFIYTIASDPESDGPTSLAAFAKQFSPSAGWSFLSGEPAAIDAIARVFFVHAGAHGRQPQSHADDGGHVAMAASRDCSLGLMRYGNDAAGLWGSVPTKLDPELIVQRLEWVSPSRPPATLTRKGPRLTT